VFYLIIKRSRYLLSTICIVVINVFISFSFFSCQKDRNPEYPIPSDSLVLYYAFNSNANDLSGGENNGRLINVSFCTDRKGKPASSVILSGEYSMILFNPDERLEELPLSFSFWFNTDSIIGPILNTSLNTYNYEGVFFSFGSLPESRNMITMSYGNGGAIGVKGRRSAIAMRSLQKRTWYHVAGIVKDEKELQLYINGKKARIIYSGLARNYVYNSTSGIIGRTWNQEIYYKGCFDDFRIYNRTLTKKEIRALSKE